MNLAPLTRRPRSSLHDDCAIKWCMCVCVIDLASGVEPRVECTWVWRGYWKMRWWWWMFGSRWLLPIWKVGCPELRRPPARVLHTASLISRLIYYKPFKIQPRLFHPIGIIITSSSIILIQGRDAIVSLTSFYLWYNPILLVIQFQMNVWGNKISDILVPPPPPAFLLLFACRMPCELLAGDKMEEAIGQSSGTSQWVGGVRCLQKTAVSCVIN